MPLEVSAVKYFSLTKVIDRLPGRGLSVVLKRY
jgi:hypothetical protein